MLYTITEGTLDVVLHYQRSENVLGPTYRELCDLVRNIKNWDDISFAPELFQSVLFYDMYATRVIIDGAFVGYIDNVNSPVMHWFINYANLNNVLTIETSAKPHFVKNKIQQIELFVKVVTEDKKFFELVEHMKLVDSEREEVIGGFYN